MGKTSYLIAIGSNRRHRRHGAPSDVVRAAQRALAAEASLIRSAPILRTKALGPAGRAFANSAVCIETEMRPDELLIRLKQIEHRFGRRRGRRWGPRVLDLDIILWSGGKWRGRGLAIPHSEFRERLFVLEPLHAIAPCWRDPTTGRTIRQLRFAGRRRKPVDPPSPAA